MNSFVGSTHIWKDGEIKEIESVGISIFTHALHYGSSVFEGIRSYNGAPFQMRAHYLRLFHSASIMDMQIKYTIEELEKATIDVLKKNNLENAYIRPIVYKGLGESLRLNASVKTECAIAAWHLTDYHKTGKSKEGIKLTFSKFARAQPECWPFSAKIGGLYAINQIARSNIGEYDDAIMLDWRGYIAECTTSNIFMVKNGQIFTPIADCFLNGITRQTVLKIAYELQVHCQEVRISKEDLMNADEVFITGTAVEIVPVSLINDTKFEIGPITSKLKEVYANLANKIDSNNT